MLRTAIVAILAAVSAAAPAHAALAPIIVQPIVLCSGSTDDTCTRANADYASLFNQSVLNGIYAQTATTNSDGSRNDDAINFSIRAPNMLLNSPYTTVTIDPSGNFSDTGHVLLRTLNSITANESPNTINVYLVNQIDSGSDKTYGFGLISSNGILIETDARPDTLAHELGHNLGLSHYADPGNDASATAADLMAPGVVRDIPNPVASTAVPPVIDPRIGTSIDLLTPTQDAIVHEPLFSIQGASATLGADAGYPDARVCKPGLFSCTLFITSNAADSKQALEKVIIRWTDPHALDGVLLDPLLHGFLGGTGVTDDMGCYQEDLTPSSILDASKTNVLGSQLTVTFHPGCLLPGRVSQIAFTRQSDSWAYETPLSVEFDFDNGSTSLGDLDAVGSFLAAANTFNAIDTSNFADQVYNEALPVPEPASFSLMLAAVLPLMGRAGRGSRRSVLKSVHRTPVCAWWRGRADNLRAPS